MFGVVDDTTTTKFANRACAVHGISLPVVVDKVVVVVLNPFAPEPPVTARADPGPFYPSTLTVKDNFLRTRVQSEEIFQTIPE